MAAIQKRLARTLVTGFSALAVLATLVWFGAMAYVLITAYFGFAEIQARPPAQANARIISEFLEPTTVHEHPNNRAAPFGWVIGQTSCAQAQQQFPQSDQDHTYAVFGGSVWSVGSQTLAATQIPDLLGLAIICSKNDVVTAVLLTFSKSRHELTGLEAMAHDLDTHYSVERAAAAPTTEDGNRHVFGVWKAHNATIDLQYIDTDRRFDLSYISPCYAKATRELDAIHNKQSVEEQQQIRDDATAGLDLCMQELRTSAPESTHNHPGDRNHAP